MEADIARLAASSEKDFAVLRAEVIAMKVELIAALDTKINAFANKLLTVVLAALGLLFVALGFR